MATHLGMALLIGTQLQGNFPATPNATCFLLDSLLVFKR